jgi:hypothetical protein
VALGTVTCDVRLWAVPPPAVHGDAQEVAEPFQLDQGGADPALLAGSGTLIWADQFRAGYLTPALSWLATEMLAAGLLLGVAAVVLIIVPVRLAGRPGPPSPGSAPAA